MDLEVHFFNFKISEMWLQWELAHPLREILVPPPPNNMNTCVIAIVALDLKEITKTVEDVGATEFSKVLGSVGLDRMLSEANYTIFTPTDEKFKQYEPPRVCKGSNVFV